ncbi:hypothetical protein GCM10011401_16150 [Nesterenkonia cremea]|uniref:Uncharacterized protein n=1 Tax=Nesterenkonia cremea TaxID=1882340 RepID=A0A917ARS4_9MICC|nr:hypothetical protein GCM10011401_16150 [Nesterenkonia cremea]
MAFVAQLPRNPDRVPLPHRNNRINCSRYRRVTPGAASEVGSGAGAADPVLAALLVQGGAGSDGDLQVREAEAQVLLDDAHQRLPRTREGPGPLSGPGPSSDLGQAFTVIS